LYAIYNAMMVWVYFGESGNLQGRLLQHLRGDSEAITRSLPIGLLLGNALGPA
jgi:hypothetical protein